MEAECLLMPRLLNMHNTTSATFYWSRQVTKAAQIQRVGKETLPVGKSHSGSVAIFNLSDQPKLSTLANLFPSVSCFFFVVLLVTIYNHVYLCFIFLVE